MGLTMFDPETDPALAWASLDEVRYWNDLPCGRRHPVTGRACDKPVGHWRFRDHRRYHRSDERHSGRMAETYPATWVHVWRDEKEHK